mmetsp:Transcript_11894/g.24598  ORF Transcript_11894/g.24598 Transcript_11894/m.24598 type:complete len:91 (+) Transcript_11894:445-717(+)
MMASDRLSVPVIEYGSNSIYLAHHALPLATAAVHGGEVVGARRGGGDVEVWPVDKTRLSYLPSSCTSGTYPSAPHPWAADTIRTAAFCSR